MKEKTTKPRQAHEERLRVYLAKKEDKKQDDK